MRKLSLRVRSWKHGVFFFWSSYICHFFFFFTFSLPSSVLLSAFFYLLLFDSQPFHGPPNFDARYPYRPFASSRFTRDQKTNRNSVEDVGEYRSRSMVPYLGDENHTWLHTCLYRCATNEYMSGLNGGSEMERASVFGNKALNHYVVFAHLDEKRIFSVAPISGVPSFLINTRDVSKKSLYQSSKVENGAWIIPFDRTTQTFSIHLRSLHIIFLLYISFITIILLKTCWRSNPWFRNTWSARIFFLNWKFRHSRRRQEKYHICLSKRLIKNSFDWRFVPKAGDEHRVMQSIISILFQIYPLLTMNFQRRLNMDGHVVKSVV